MNTIPISRDIKNTIRKYLYPINVKKDYELVLYHLSLLIRKSQILGYSLLYSGTFYTDSIFFYCYYCNKKIYQDRIKTCWVSKCFKKNNRNANHIFINQTCYNCNETCRKKFYVMGELKIR